MMMHRVVYVMLNKRSFESFVCFDLPHNTLSRTCFLLLIVLFFYFIFYLVFFFILFGIQSRIWGLGSNQTA